MAAVGEAGAGSGAHRVQRPAQQHGKYPHGLQAWGAAAGDTLGYLKFSGRQMVWEGRWEGQHNKSKSKKEARMTPIR
eukprot:2507155-Karenia_brevis.AAC.1